jgi:hypothetical protein
VSDFPYRWSKHALDKLAFYGMIADQLEPLIIKGIRYLDRQQHSDVIVFYLDKRPWIAIVNPKKHVLITIYPSDQAMIDNRIGGGRWTLPNNYEE